MNCQISGLASIRKGLRKDDTPFLVSSNSIIASENVSGRVSGENLESSREAIFTNPGWSQSGGAPNFANPEGSQFCQTGGVLFLPIRRGHNFANPEGSRFCQSGGVLILPVWRGPVVCRSGGVLFLSIRRGIILLILK